MSLKIYRFCLRSVDPSQMITAQGGWYVLAVRSMAIAVLPEGEVSKLGWARHQYVEGGYVSFLQWFGRGPYHYGIAKLEPR